MGWKTLGIPGNDDEDAESEIQRLKADRDELKRLLTNFVSHYYSMKDSPLWTEAHEYLGSPCPLCGGTGIDSTGIYRCNSCQKK